MRRVCLCTWSPCERAYRISRDYYAMPDSRAIPNVCACYASAVMTTARAVDTYSTSRSYTCILCTVSASILQSFVFAIAAFTPPARPSLMRAAAAERLAGAPSGAAPHRRVEGLVEFCD